MMKPVNQRLWPFRRQTSIFAAGAILIILLAVLLASRKIYGWPAEASETTVLIGVLILTLLPFLLVLLDTVIDRGGVIEYGGIKVDFSRGRDTGTVGITVAANISVPGQFVTDSGSDRILDALRQATSSDVAIVDLEDGQAWWETRLFVLVAGAERLGRPGAMVFVGTEAKKKRVFQGWSRPSDLLRELIKAHPQHARSLQASRAAARQWALVEPHASPVAFPASPTPNQPVWLTTGLANAHQWGFDDVGLQNELYAERLLQSEVGDKIERVEKPRGISLVRLKEILQPVLLMDHIDLSWPADRQLTEFLNTTADNIAITQDGRYESLVPKLTLLTEAVKSLVKSRQSD